MSLCAGAPAPAAVASRALEGGPLQMATSGKAVLYNEPSAKHLIQVQRSLDAKLQHLDAIRVRTILPSPKPACALASRMRLPALACTLQTPFGSDNKDSALPTISEKDKQRIEKIRAKEESAARAAFEVRTNDECSADTCLLRCGSVSDEHTDLLVHVLVMCARHPLGFVQAHKQRADEAVRGAIPTIVRDKSGAGGGGPRDLHLDNFNVSNGGKDLIVDASVTLAYGRRYGLVGRNGTGTISATACSPPYPAPPSHSRPHTAYLCTCIRSTLTQPVRTPYAWYDNKSKICL